MTLAPHSMLPIPFPVPATPPALALSHETVTVDVSELVAFAERLDAHAARDGEHVSARAIVAKAYLVASIRHPGVDARWPVLPARHGVLLRELTAALDGPDAASAIPDNAAVLSVGAITRQPWTQGAGIELRDTVTLTLAFDPRRVDPVGAGGLLAELAGLLADPWELIAQS